MAGLDHQSFWIDEIASLKLAQDGLLDGFRRIRGDVHPPGYFALLHLWIQAVGRSESAVRWLSVIPSLLTIGALFRLGRLLYGPHQAAGRRIGLMAAAIAAGSLCHIYYAQEARSYAWLMLLATLSMDATARFAASGRRRDLARYAVTAAALLYTHYFGIFAVAAQNVFVLALWWGARGPGEPQLPLRRWLVVQAGIALAFLPWLPSLVAQIQQVRTGFWIGEPSLAGLGTAFLRFASLTGPWSQGGPPGWLSLTVGGVVVAAAIAGAALVIWRALGRAQHTGGAGGVGQGPDAAARRRYDSRLLLGLWLLLPPLAGWSLSLFGLDVFSYRNTMISAPAFALLLAVLCDRLSQPRWKALAVATLLSPSLLQAPGYYREPHKDQWREAARYVEMRYSAETDAVAFDAPFIRGSFLHYAPGLREALTSQRDIDLHAAGPPDQRRIWLVRAYAGPRSKSSKRIVRWGYREMQRIELVAIEIVLFARPAEPDEPDEPDPAAPRARQAR